MKTAEPANPALSSSGTEATGLLDRLRAAAGDIKLSHSVFALPFALLATFLASAHAGALPTGATLLLIVLCMFFARTTAMAFNRMVDARLDALNPRTRGRAIPSGRLGSGFMAACAAICALLFMSAAAGFLLVNGNPWPVALSPLVLAWLCLYSLTKRFTWMCHLFLGSALALSPIAATIAVNPAFLRTPEPYLLAGMVLSWVAGFDILYALQDVEVDRAQGLYSMPAKLGIERALWISGALHLASFTALVMLAIVSASLAGGFALGVGAVGVLLLLEHALVWRSATRHIDMAFFTLNGVISLALGAMGIVDVWRAVG